MVIVRLPAGLRAPGENAELRVDADVATVGELLTTLCGRRPGLRDDLDDGLYNVAVNDTLLLHAAAAHPLRDGDIVEFIPTLSGG